MKYFIALMLFLFSVNAMSGKYSATGVVKEIKMFSENPDVYNPSHLGRLYIYLDELPKACDSNNRRIVISSNHPLFQSVLSMAIVSNTTKVPVEVWYIDTCSQHSNAWDFSILHLK